MQVRVIVSAAVGLECREGESRVARRLRGRKGGNNRINVSFQGSRSGGNDLRVDYHQRVNKTAVMRHLVRRTVLASGGRSSSPFRQGALKYTAYLNTLAQAPSDATIGLQQEGMSH
jgi:hypothetical protein